jgi:hypothetical protein
MLARTVFVNAFRSAQPRVSRSPRRALVVGLTAFVAATLGCAWAMERADGFRDPVYGQKESRLRTIARTGEPLILILGSSRVENGINAGHAEVVLRQSTGQRINVFNFGISGAGPLMMSVCLNRLLARGTIPDRIVIEVLPKMLSNTANGPPELAWLNPDRFSHRERAELARLSPAGTAHWHSSTMPWRDYSKQFLFRMSPTYVPPSVTFAWTQPMDDHGWSRFFQNNVTAEQRRNWTERAERECRPNLESFQAGVAAASFRHLIETCQEREIPVHLLLMPEGTAFHSWYGPGANERLAAFLATLPVPVTDARRWMPDDAFADGHHLLPHAATIFSERLASEVLYPQLESGSP